MENFKNACVDISDVCKELREHALEKSLTQKKIQLLHANSHELRLLERNIQSAIVFKELSKQQQDIAQRKENELRIKREENAKFQVECELFHKSVLQHEEQAKVKKRDILQYLKFQITDKQEKRRIEFESTKKDSDEINNLLDQIQSEKIAEYKQARLLQEAYKKEIDEFHRTKELQKQFEKQRNYEDNERIIAYQKECDHLKSLRIAEERRVQEEKLGITDRLVQQLAVVNNEKEKRRALLASLLLEERRAKDEQNYRETLVQQIKKREQMRNDMENFLKEYQFQKEKKFKEEEYEFLEKHLRFLEERDKLNQLSDEKRRRKKIEHNKALREIIEIRRIQKADDIAARIADFETLLNAQNESKLVIEEERKRMLNAIPKDLLRYLPKGASKSSD